MPSTTTAIRVWIKYSNCTSMARQPNNEPTIVKAPHQKLRLTAHQNAEFLRCALDPVYFIKTYAWVQHPVKGRLPFELYDYQEDMVRTYANNRQVVAMCSRQLGKCVVSDTEITQDGKEVEIGSLIKLSFRQRLVDLLERLLVKLSQMK
jgi:hypothetical protein